MQTFVPYSSAGMSALCLDMKRLNKQRAECKQILRACFGLTKGWQNHPATLMWVGSEEALCEYSIIMCRVWVNQGGKDKANLLGEFEECYIYLRNQRCKDGPITTTPKPVWWGSTLVHDSHKSNLMRKDKRHYSRFFGADYPDSLEYYWPKNY